MRQPKTVFVGNRVSSSVSGYIHANIEVRENLDRYNQALLLTLTWQSGIIPSEYTEECADLWYGFNVEIPKGSYRSHFDVRVSALRKFLRKWEKCTTMGTPAAAIGILKAMNCQEVVYDGRHSRFILYNEVENPTWSVWALFHVNNVYRRVIAPSREYAMSMLWKIAAEEDDRVLSQLIESGTLKDLSNSHHSLLPNMTTTFERIHKNTVWMNFEKEVDAYGVEIEGRVMA